MALDRSQPWQAITFRNDPQEYAMTHAVHVKVEKDGVQEAFFVDPALCGKRLPENMVRELGSFDMFINTSWLSCPACQLEVNKLRR